MFTEQDEGKGLVKVYWEDVRERVAQVNLPFAQIVDGLHVDKKYPLYLAYYPYGALKGDTESTFLPQMNGESYRLTDPMAPKDVIKNLGYGKDSAPLALLLDKNLELFIDLKEEGITIPRMLYSPGSLFPLARVLSRKSSRTYAPNGVLTLTSGARSTFVLPNIGCVTNHSNLQSNFNVKTPAPKSLYEHWYVFKEIANSSVVNCDWRSCVMYFSQNWLDSLCNDKAWLGLKLYLHELAWQYYEYQRNGFYYDIAFSIIQKRRNLKPNPYIADTAKHLFITALGAAPGYAPALNNAALPLDLLEKVFVETYGLKKYFPTILHPKHFSFEMEVEPIYYSLQHPSTHVFSPKSRKESSTLMDLRELEHITKVFTQELIQDKSMCSGTVMSQVATNIEFNYFHNKNDRQGTIQPTVNIPKLDNRFINQDKKNSEMAFASDAPFVRGCVSMQVKT